MAEDELDNGNRLYCLGDIVHNDIEVKRLKAKGLEIIDHDGLRKLKNCKVLIRAHGEPPETYRIALENNIELIDASCPVVLKLQNRIKNVYDGIDGQSEQIVIYGKPGHAEVNGLVGQTHGEAIIITSEDDLDKIDYTRPVVLFSQTTKSTAGFYKIKEIIESKISAAIEEDGLIVNDTICRQVAKREPLLKEFVKKYDVIIFVSGKKSSNGKILFQACKMHNPNTHFVSDESELNRDWFENIDNIGICGATSTPMWLMEKIKSYIQKDILEGPTT